MTLFYDNMGIVREETGVKNSLYRTEISSSKLNDNSFFSVNVFFFPKYSFFGRQNVKEMVIHCTINLYMVLRMRKSQYMLNTIMCFIVSWEISIYLRWHLYLYIEHVPILKRIRLDKYIGQRRVFLCEQNSISLYNVGKHLWYAYIRI